jgi:hypothetical protein
VTCVAGMLCSLERFEVLRGAASGPMITQPPAPVPPLKRNRDRRATACR